MNNFKKIAVNTLLIGVLFSLLFLPFGVVGLAGVAKDDVLSDTDRRLEQPTQEEVMFKYEEPFEASPSSTELRYQIDYEQN